MPYPAAMEQCQTHKQTKKAIAIKLKICYIKNIKGATAHKVVDLQE